MKRLDSKRIVLCVSAGIAAYKACTLCRLLIKEGAEVKVLMTKKAHKLIGADTFAALSGHKVSTKLFADSEQISHISTASSADLIVLAPATANTLAKIAHGLADNLVTTAILAATCPVLLAPAMNDHMLSNPATQENLKLLLQRGLNVMPPAQGSLACGSIGNGRMREPEEILEYIVALLTKQIPQPQLGFKDNTLLTKQDPLALEQQKLLTTGTGVGLKIVITAGPTQEPLDPVRVFTNHSSGKMGYALARAAARSGAQVVLISGPCQLQPPAGITTIRVNTALQMLDALNSQLQDTDIVIGCAAVSDYRPLQVATSKLSSAQQGDKISVEMVKNPDLISSVGHLEQNRPFTVGFAAQTDHDEQYAQEKLLRKNLDLIILNNVAGERAGFGSDDNEVTIFNRDGRLGHLPLQSKDSIAQQLLDLILPYAKSYLKER